MFTYICMLVCQEQNYINEIPLQGKYFIKSILSQRPCMLSI